MRTKFLYTDQELDKVVEKLENIRNKILDITTSVLDEKSLFTREENYVKRNLSTLTDLQSDMDRILCDFYHILGMVKLNAAQIARITSRVIKLLEVRNDLKRSIIVLQTYKSLLSQIQSGGAEYKIKVLGDKKTIKIE